MDQRAQQWPPVRRKPSQPSWKRKLRKYWPPIRFGLILVALLVVVGLGITALSNIGEVGSSETVHNSMDASIPNETTPPTVESMPDDSQMQLAAQEVLNEAAFIAAGYDYAEAINILQAFPYYDHVPELAEKVAEYEALDAQLVSYPYMNEITHIFFHSLVVDPSRAFDSDYTNDGYNLYMTTVSEFKGILEQMYERGYVLVSPYDVAYEVTDASGTHFSYGDIRLPEGKVPFIMSQDDLNYYGYMIGAEDGSGDVPIYATTAGDGFAHRIVIGDDGFPTCEYMDQNGNVTTGDYDLVPVLETFIQEHPDFSYHGARAVLGMTGYEGVFGYRTKPNYKPALSEEEFQSEVEQAKAVAQCLRDHGWVLASHSYGHPAYGNIPADRVAADSDKWENTVQVVIGDTDVILYPHGSDIAGLEMYTFDNAKFAALYEDGYRYFFNVDSSIAWCQLGENYFRGGRRNLDGYRMWHNPELLKDLFNVEDVFDPERPTPVPNI